MMDGAVTHTKTLQRARGTVDVGFAADALARLYQAGAAKALLPRSYGPAHEVVLVNTAGGITGGDNYDYRCMADASNMVVTTQAAERAYRSSHARSTHHVVVQTLEVTPEQAQLAYDLARKAGPVPGAFCANSTSQILRQIPGLEGISTTFYPTNLVAQFDEIPGVVSNAYYEDDSGDLQVGLAQNNAALNQQAAN